MRNLKEFFASIQSQLQGYLVFGFLLTLGPSKLRVQKSIYRAEDPRGEYVNDMLAEETVVME